MVKLNITLDEVDKLIEVERTLGLEAAVAQFEANESIRSQTYLALMHELVNLMIPNRSDDLPHLKPYINFKKELFKTKWPATVMPAGFVDTLQERRLTRLILPPGTKANEINDPFLEYLVVSATYDLFNLAETGSSKKRKFHDYSRGFSHESGVIEPNDAFRFAQKFHSLAWRLSHQIKEGFFRGAEAHQYFNLAAKYFKEILFVQGALHGKINDEDVAVLEEFMSYTLSNYEFHTKGTLFNLKESIIALLSHDKNITKKGLEFITNYFRSGAVDNRISIDLPLILQEMEDRRRHRSKVLQAISDGGNDIGIGYDSSLFLRMYHNATVRYQYGIRTCQEIMYSDCFWYNKGSLSSLYKTSADLVFLFSGTGVDESKFAKDYFANDSRLIFVDNSDSMRAKTLFAPYLFHIGNAGILAIDADILDHENFQNAMSHLERIQGRRRIYKIDCTLGNFPMQKQREILQTVIDTMENDDVLLIDLGLYTGREFEVIQGNSESVVDTYTTAYNSLEQKAYNLATLVTCGLNPSYVNDATSFVHNEQERGFLIAAEAGKETLRVVRVKGTDCEGNNRTELYLLEDYLANKTHILTQYERFGFTVNETAGENGEETVEINGRYNSLMSRRYKYLPIGHPYREEDPEVHGFETSDISRLIEGFSNVEWQVYASHVAESDKWITNLLLANTYPHVIIMCRKDNNLDTSTITEFYLSESDNSNL